MDRDVEREEGGGGLLVRVPVGAVIALLGCGAVLAALPWVALPAPMELPSRIEAGSRAHARLVRLCVQVDEACARGDVKRLRELLTPEMWGRTARLLREARRSPDGRTLQQQRYVIGDLEPLELIRGASANERAVLVFLRARPTRAGGFAVRRSLLAIGFAWDGFRFLVDEKISRAVGATGGVGSAAESLALSVLTQE